LGTNLTRILNNTQFASDPSEITGLKLGQTAVQPNVHATAGEINVPTVNISSQISQGDVQFLSGIPATEDDVIDLTTFDGLSKLTRTIRLFADEGPNRGGGDASSTVLVPSLPPEAIREDPPKEPLTIFSPPPTFAGTAGSVAIGTIAGLKISPLVLGGALDGGGALAPAPSTNTSFGLRRNIIIEE
jgi:hypothetical protein